MPAEPAIEPIAARIAHRIPGRLRIMLTDAAEDALDRAVETLGALDAVEAIEARPLTGSIVVRHKGEITDAILEAAGFRVETGPAASGGPIDPVDPIRAAFDQIVKLDAAVARGTDGRMDLWGLTFTALVAGGVIQLARGRVAGPALAMFGQAATVAMARPLRRFIP